MAFNKSMEGKISQKLETCKVIAKFEEEDIANFENYRPICLLGPLWKCSKKLHK